MLSRLDEIIYPNRCEVIELASQRYFYPIFKNGSSSVYDYATQNKCKILLNQQLSKLSVIDVVLRDPVERTISGMQTFIYNTKQSVPTLDADTIKWFAENYQFLNRHYAPQLSWLINLNRYTKAKLRFFGMEELSNITDFVGTPRKVSTDINLNLDFEMFIRLDKLLMNLVGKELTFDEVLTYLKQEDKTAFQKLQCIVLD